MPKIQDLGINRIPSTMQPPAVGEGGVPADKELDYTASQDSTQRSSNSCPEEEAQEATAFTPDAVAQLRQQIERMSANV